MAELGEYWTYRFILNICGYAVLLLPLFAIVWYFKTHPSKSSGCYFRVITFFVFDSEATLPLSDDNDKLLENSQLSFGAILVEKTSRIRSSPHFQAAKLIFCFLGLQFCYLTWGYYQERVMTVSYVESSKIANSPQLEHANQHAINVNDTINVSKKTVGEYFRDSQFLVLVNRICALLLSGSILLTRAILAKVQSRQHHSQTTRPAAYKYSLPSLSNTLSSWFQYEALKYVSFPTQVVCKSAKVVATMCMSKLLSITSSRRRVTFSILEWVTACAISGGVCMFLLGSEYEEFKVRSKFGKTSTAVVTDYDQMMRTLSGAVILIGYLASDSFTTTYQSALFKQHKISSVTMMFAINVFSIACCGTSLLLQGAFGGIWHFAVAHPEFLMHVSVISLTSAIGQLFIYFTISQFGAVTFALIMTARQVISIFISCAAFGHPVTILGWIGLLVAVAASIVRTNSGLTRG